MTLSRRKFLVGGALAVAGVAMTGYAAYRIGMSVEPQKAPRMSEVFMTSSVEERLAEIIPLARRRVTWCAQTRTAHQPFESAFVVLMASIHYYAPDDEKIWSHLGLSFAIVYAAMCSINYYLQLTVVRDND